MGASGGLGRFDYPETIQGLSRNLGWRARAGKGGLGWSVLAGLGWARFLMKKVGPTKKSNDFSYKFIYDSCRFFAHAKSLIHQQKPINNDIGFESIPKTIDLFTCKINRL